MKEAILYTSAKIIISGEEFEKVKDWDIERLKSILQEIRHFEMRFKFISGIKMMVSVISPTDLEIANVIQLIQNQSDQIL
jgi:hypothetical protein